MERCKLPSRATTPTLGFWHALVRLLTWSVAWDQPGGSSEPRTIIHYSKEPALPPILKNHRFRETRSSAPKMPDKKALKTAVGSGDRQRLRRGQVLDAKPTGKTSQFPAQTRPHGNTAMRMSCIREYLNVNARAPRERRRRK